MKKAEYGVNGFEEAFNILCSHSDEVYGEIQIAWGVVEPGHTSQPHQHSEKEVYIIISGNGFAHSRNEEFSVKAGDIILIDPLETHYLSNNSDTPLVVADLYWHAGSSELNVIQANKANNLDTPIFVFSPPPTPNGDLHLGHLSGPYLGADVYKRFERMRGRKVFHLTGSDDFQSYVRSLAEKSQGSEYEVALQYSDAIRHTLDLFDVEYDNFLCTSTDEPYKVYMQAQFNALREYLDYVKGPSLFDATTNQYLYEVDVRGECPTCGSDGNGNICEQCGAPNTCVDLKNSFSNITNTKAQHGESERFSLALHRYYQVIRDHLDQSKLSPRVRVLVEDILARETFDLPLTHLEKWGVKVGDQKYDDQSIWVWVNMFFGFMYAIDCLGKRQGEDWSEPSDDWKIVHFFGFDNSFYYTVLYPVLFKLAYPSWKTQVDYNYNEFYLLEHKKFSTSRRHVIWGKEILNHHTTDIIRYFLSKTRSEYDQTNFDLSELLADIESTLINKWENWTAALQQKVKNDFAGVTPSTGLWMPEYGAYVDSLASKLQQISVYYTSENFSLRAAIKAIDSIVDDVISFSAYCNALKTSENFHSYYRTVVALEVSTLKALAEAVYPVMPRYSKHLLTLLGMSETPTWPDKVTLLDGGIQMDVESGNYFAEGYSLIKQYRSGRA
ncbi:methionyl-tRNA synthetase [Thalassolituus maritimus]|uniref:Methionyl-tRNA synthetase n=1 Tax=Thalassolituus maritimus TaxID=484498 RepID=A0A1N7Q9N7_9GAMM|nr:class I tRNA ligase family protein [Thalassolituus maritimus]SIT19449.1 methionyl-tRNA synthetase [Thalassolituus maritimus]